MIEIERKVYKYYILTRISIGRFICNFRGHKLKVYYSFDIEWDACTRCGAHSPFRSNTSEDKW